MCQVESQSYSQDLIKAASVLASSSTPWIELLKGLHETAQHLACSLRPHKTSFIVQGQILSWDGLSDAFTNFEVLVALVEEYHYWFERALLILKAEVESSEVRKTGNFKTDLASRNSHILIARSNYRQKYILRKQRLEKKEKMFTKGPVNL